MWLAEVPNPAEPWYFCKKHLKSDIGKGALAGAARSKRLQFQALTDFRSQTLQLQILKRTLRGVLAP